MTQERVQELLEFSNSMNLYDLEFLLNINAEKISIPIGINDYVESNTGRQAHIDGAMIALVTDEFFDMCKKKKEESIDNEIGNILNDEK